MKNTKKLSYLFFMLTCIFFFSCKEESAEQKVLKSNNYVNNWMYGEMDFYYLWNDYLPAKPDYNLNPNDFFQSICYWYDKNTNPEGDRFSWIQENYVDLMNMLTGISSDEIGFELMLYYLNQQKDIVGEIQYVKKNTPAQQAGLKRGQFFSKINGTALNESNYGDLLFNLKGNFSITLHDIEAKNGSLIFTDTIEKNISTISNYADDPVFLDTIYSVNNKNIGYLVYNFFADDPNDNSKKYDVELANVFSNFKQKNITDLIVDLRYNSGGSLESAVDLASMLVKNRSTKEVFLRGEYNSILTKAIVQQEGESALYSYFVDTIANKNKQALPNVGDLLQNLVILTGPYTASASEMVINGLKPYMNVTLLGDTTIGKNVGSITIYDEKNTNKNKWGIQPIITKLYNSANQSDFTAGFIPNILDQDDYYPKYDLGDLREGMLNNAIGYITDSSSPELKSSGIRTKRISLRSIDASVSRKTWTNKIIMPANSLPKPE
ncbi:MAG: S41 family peptidase [Candidatus Azobacteroides sp.]|nr:S41 family peptidase [Candidatus Azobacteroides sp.]